jgi:signal transduction histidine kinase
LDERFLDEVKRFVDFREEDARALASLRPVLEAHAHAIVELFYQRILEHPRASKAITGGPDQVERLKATLRVWLVELGSGVYSSAYLEKRAAIGRRHVVIDLPQVFMVTAVDVVRCELARIIRDDLASDLSRREEALTALQKILDIDLAIMLETYHEDTVEKVRRSERRAMIGDLAAKVNHELRNRLGTIKSSAFLLEKQLKDAPDSAVKHLKKIQWGAARAGATVAALLNLARELQPQMTVTDMNHLAREAVAAVVPVSNVSIELELARESPRVRGDPELLVSVVSNLVQNAVEAHEGKGGRVVVRTAVVGGSVFLRVLDEGRGLSDEVAPHIFEPFFTTKVDGAGLGLTIAQEVVAAHGGKLEARSRRDRGGAEFVVELTLEAEASAR